jgi:cupin fold WbuC family metalloprotein
MKKISEEVYYSEERLAPVGSKEVDFIRTQARMNSRKRCRVCVHGSPDDLLHEMMIALARDSYVRPHKHPGKAESLHIIEGEACLVFFDDDGAITQVTRLAPVGSKDPFFFRIAEPRFHTIIVQSDALIFHETTTGPFVREETILAPWAPEEGGDDGRAYQRQLLDWIARTCEG